MKTDINSDLSSYFNKDIENPDYLYFGSAHEIDFEKLKEDNINNYSFEMHLTSHYNTAVASAFAEMLDENSQGIEHTIQIHHNNIPILVADNVRELDDSAKGYFYIFECPDDAKKEKNYYFKINEPILPIKVKDLIYRDHKGYYKIYPASTKTK